MPKRNNIRNVFGNIIDNHMTLPATPRFNQSIILAEKIAAKIGDKYVGIEHLKLALCQLEFPVEFDKLLVETKRNLTINKK